MANEDFGVRFSENCYATKQEVAKTIGFSSVDDIWNRILAYRSHFYRALSLRNIDKSPYQITFTPTINEHLAALERKLTKAYLKYATMNHSLKKGQIREDHYTRILYWVAKKYNLDVDETMLYHIIHHEASTLPPDAMLLVNYFNALEYIEEHYVDPLDAGFIKRLYSLLLGYEMDEETSLYRTKELFDVDARALIGRTYNSAPVERIAPMMDQLFDFIMHADFSPTIKAVVSYFYISHIKPFDVYSEEIAMLFMKSVFAHSDLDELASILEWEQLLSDNQEEVNRLLSEVKKSNDITYFLVYYIEVGDSIANDLLDDLTKSSVASIKEEYYDTGVEEPQKEENEGSIQPIHRTHEATPNLSEPLSEEASSQVSFEVSVALPTLPIGLDEKDAMKIEEHLVEIYPTLKRGQAYFYARHCTIGKYYTIAQYKKLLHCAYETARTSMDNLVELGFYRKEKLNNKFIYTPVSRR